MKLKNVIVLLIDHIVMDMNVSHVIFLTSGILIKTLVMNVTVDWSIILIPRDVNYVQLKNLLKLMENVFHVLMNLILILIQVYVYLVLKEVTLIKFRINVYYLLFKNLLNAIMENNIMKVVNNVFAQF